MLFDRKVTYPTHYQVPLDPENVTDAMPFEEVRALLH
jgi:hypothetical protein